jgi:FAD/FMN-containing dehydrogenase
MVTTISESRIGELVSGLRGRVIRPGDGDYDAARKVWNRMADKRPALIAQCLGAADVLHCVRFAREHDLLVSVRGGGHNYAGKSVCDDGLTIDLSLMKGIRVDPVRRTAAAQPGVKLGEFDHETQAFGLATTLGIATDTGIAGLTLGGGYGWLGGKYGLACDNLISVDVVTADGQLLTASASENPDLFWGVRGAGANFGIVTSFEYRLHPVGPTILGGIVLYPMTQGKETLRLFDEFSSTCPDEVSLNCLLMTAPDGTPAVGIAACYCGPLEQGEEVLRPLRTAGSPLADLIAPMPYVQMQALFDDPWQPRRIYYSKSSIVRRLNEAAIEAFLELARTNPTPLGVIAFQQLHGAASRVGAGETAFPHRYDHHSVYIHPATDDPADSPTIIRWAQEGWQAVQPFVEKAMYVNGLEDALEEGEQRVQEAYGPNYAKLVALKNKYDPTNFFRLNANIKPAM